MAFSTFSVFITAEWLVWRLRGIKKFELKDSPTNYSLVATQFWLGVIGKALFIFAPRPDGRRNIGGKWPADPNT